MRILKISLLMMALLFSTSSIAQETATVLHILYTQNNNGELVNCHCPSNPLGGFEKRSTFFAQWLGEYPNTLIFDSGDFLTFDGGEDVDAKVIELMEGLHYTAVNIGDQEFSNGIRFFNTYLKPGKLPLLSSNLMIDGEEKPAFKRYQSLSVAGIRIVITGVLGPENVQYFTKSMADSKVWSIDPEKALRIVHDHETAVKKADVHILLSNLGFDKDLELAGKLSFLDIIIGGHSQHKFKHAAEQSGTLIVQCGKNGQYVGHLEITMVNGQITGHKHELIPMGVDIPDDQNILKIIQEM
ncbi:MAG: hypothetical protein U9Q77_13705 [Candidatus Marinimicrobia bacterium]|nr:hypothetical protein [Candidatus Neomarinimicrobiota bacterium]